MAVFESRYLKVMLGELKVMIGGGITEAGLLTCELDPCGVCSLTVKAKSVVCVQCGKWFHDRCTGVIRFTTKCLANFAYRKCIVNIGDAVKQEEELRTN